MPSAAARRAPTLSRRHAAGAASARGLLFTVLGEFVLPHGGSAWTSTLIDVLARAGVEEKACRQALMRTAADGWLTARRDGRRTCWNLTADAEQLLRSGAERIYGFAGEQRDWDGRWLLVLARAGEDDRRARHVLRTRLTWAGLGSPAPGVWVSTHPERVDEVHGALDRAGVRDGAQVFVAEHRDGELAALIAQAWDLDDVNAAYTDFLAAFTSARARDPLAGVVELVHAWRRFPFLDPELPTRLLPARWSGARAARLFRRRHTQWAAAATAEWRRIAAQAKSVR